ncbi:hypothetical protein J6X13_00550 [Candidatus Saccharibacteria bacterium]|nr:hypothetical protein [Candidatus Saccharibacteria bacterium]
MATPVVEPVKAPKVKASNGLVAGINAVSMALACFMGWMAIFAGIAHFTNKGWGVRIPFADLIFGTNVSNVSVAFIAGIAAVLFAVIALISAGKITDINAMKGAWKNVRNAFVVIAAIEIVKMVAIAIYSLCGIGEKSGVDQGYLWLNDFLSNTLAAMAAVGIVFIAHFIAAGKTQVLSVMRFVALGIAAVGCVLIMVSTIVKFYNKKSSAASSYSSASSALNSIDWGSLFGN